MKNQDTQSNLLTVAQFVKKHPFTSNGGMRHWIFNAKINGFHKVIRKIGRRVLINETAFFEWIEETNNKTK